MSGLKTQPWLPGQVFSTDAGDPNEYKDESGFNPDDWGHPRWLHPIEPDDPTQESPIETRLRELGIPFKRLSNSMVVAGNHRYMTLWPASDGQYGNSSAPQYAIRRDHYGSRFPGVESSIGVTADHK